MALWWMPRQVSEERGHAQELLAGVLVEQQWVLRLLRPGLLPWMLLLLLVAAGSVD
jgi:hypothetical protein